jgi:hypothetical protein
MLMRRLRESKMRRAAFVAASLIALAAMGQQARAEGSLFYHPKVDPRVRTVSFGAGIASTAAYLSIPNHRHLTVNWGPWAATTVGCMVLAPMVAAAFVPERELTSREVMVMEGSCIVPFIGGWLVNAMYDANPQWEVAEGRATKAASKTKRARR